MECQPELHFSETTTHRHLIMTGYDSGGGEERITYNND